MDDATILFSAIEQKARDLKRQLESIQAQNSSLKNDNEYLNKIIEDQKQKIADLETKNEILNVTGSFTTEEDRDQIRKRINGLVGDIDRCINLLNT